MTLRINAGTVFAELIESGDIICRQIRAGQKFETKTLEKWAEICIGGVVIDVGCYSGLFSIIAAKRRCEVIAFEAMENHVARCLENFRRNSVTVDLRHACATDRDGMTEIRFNPKVPGLTSGASMIRPSGGRNTPSENVAVAVQGMTIDGLGLKQCTAMKIDVERGEPMVLAGARQTLERCRPVLIVEVLGEAEKRAVRACLPDYEVAEEMDVRNWLMVPR